MGKEVEFQANGVTYKGKLIQITETEVHLQTTMGWVVVQTEHITSMKEVR
ncbi:MAG TPA: hypothetical protein VJL89_01835 [Thermodesulfovibrionia bacterium]|nr:hypothetical protein [Thermodesulfovibrionia bacterium]